MFCVKCGAQLSDSVKYCNFCGAKVPEKVLMIVGNEQPRNVNNVQPAVNVQPMEPSQPITRVVVPSNGQRQGANPNEWRPATTPELGGPARRIATNRGLIKWLFLSLITFGIYGFYFIYKMAQDVNTMCKDDDQKTGGLLFFIVLSFLTLGIYSVYWWYKIANRVYLNAPQYHVMVAEKGSSFMLWYLLGLITFGIASLVGYHIVIKNVNALAAGYNRANGFA